MCFRFKHLCIKLISLFCLGACVSTAQLADEITNIQAEKAKKAFQSEIAIEIPLADGSSKVNATVFRPEKMHSPKTLIIIVPGSGNVSRLGESVGDGIHNYKSSLNLSSLWAEALSAQGIFVLAYDKRNCSLANCQKNSQSSLESLGIKALAQDFDSVYSYAKSRFLENNPGSRIVLLSYGQGAQVIAESQSARYVSKIILLSPILGNLEDIWVRGLSRASVNQDFYVKTRLMNEAESTKALFLSFKKGDFPENANIRGASLIFWRTWIEAAKNCSVRLSGLNVPTLIMHSTNDSFMTKNELNVELKKAKSSKIKAKSIDNADRNFLQNNALSAAAIASVVAEISQ
jgi:alpha-beta hydrolase superfamily lysophospholipase